MSSLSDIQQKIDTSSCSQVTISPGGDIALTSYAGEISKITCLDPYSTSGSTNDYKTFSTKIFMGKNTSALGYAPYSNGTKVGLVMHNALQSPSMYIAITQQKDSKGLIQYLLTATSDGTTNLLNSQTPFIDVTNIINDQGLVYKLGSPFSDYSKYINLRVVKTDGQLNAFEIFLNNKKVKISTSSAISPDTSGKFGTFVSGSSTTVNISEIYGTQSALNNPNISYHYQLPWFAEKIASNKKIFEISYIVQPEPIIIGINYYDIVNDHAPSMDAYPFPVAYQWYYLIDPHADYTTNLPWVIVDENSLSYSPIYHSGFRSRFAIVNCSPSQVWIKKSKDATFKSDTDFSIVSDSLLTLGPDVTIEKVFDQANINETVDITSSWIQDKNTATGILRSIYRALDGFTRDTTISIYGNPLYEIGDIVTINYGLKNIVNQRYFVQGIQQNFDTGLTTILILNQIG
jgi:hypothetical protein